MKERNRSAFLIGNGSTKYRPNSAIKETEGKENEE